MSGNKSSPLHVYLFTRFGSHRLDEPVSIDPRVFVSEDWKICFNLQDLLENNYQCCNTVPIVFVVECLNIHWNDQ